MKPTPYNQFCQQVKALGLTLAELRCDVPPTPAVLDLLDQWGEEYEPFVLRWEEECRP